MRKKLIPIVIILIIIAVGAGLFFFLPKWQKAKVAEADEFTDPRYSTKPTGIDSIQNDLDQGKINLDTALIYKVKFLFNDPTLPKEYASANGPFEDAGTFGEILENWDKLTAETKKTLAPYFLRPDNPESAMSKIMNGEISAPKTGWLKLIDQAKAFDRPLSYKSDDTLITADGKIKVWYLEKKEMVNGEEKITKLYYNVAQKIVSNLNTDGAYAQFVGLLGKTPPSDGTLGGDSKTDIFIATGAHIHLADSKGGTPSQGVNVPDNGNGKSSYIILRDNLNDKYLKTTTVHELFHAFQRAFDCWLSGTNLWWTESTATWSEDMIYPKDNTEQGYVESFIPRPATSLFENGKNFEYGAYVFPFYLSNTYDRMIVTKIFEGCTGGATPLASAEKTIDGGFKKNWKEFTLWNYNKNPIENYKKVDQSKKFTSDTSQKDNTDMIFLAPGETSIPTKELKPLTAQVIETFFSESTGVRKAVFKDLKNFTGKSPNAAIKAIIYPKNNGTPYTEDWTDKESRSFCFDKADEDFDRIILIFSNAEMKNKIAVSDIKVKTKDTCYEINQGETMTVKPIFAVTPGYVGTLKYQAEGELVKDSVPNKAKYSYLGKWQIRVDYWEHFPGQTVYGISSSAMDFAYNHYLEFDLNSDSVFKDGTVQVTTKEGKFETPGWTITNQISGESVNIPKNNQLWAVPQKGVISEMTENGCKISLPDFVLYNSGGYRDLPHPIIFEIKK
ncbi:MAG: hypothetical protein WCW26_00290 [Candidatus Buchananbacteria bacterium]